MKRGRSIQHSVPIRICKLSVQSSAIKTKYKTQYIPVYHNKLHLDQKKIIPPVEDRLSTLTINQIDRIIDEEKIQNLLSDKKKNKKEILIAKYVSAPGRHPNVYQANFLAKINRIAIERGIKFQKSHDYDVKFEEYLNGLKEMKRNSKPTQLRFTKNNNCARKVRTMSQTETTIDEPERADENLKTIDCDLEKFQVSLKEQIQQRSKTILTRKSAEKQVNKLIAQNRWFQGMSTHYLNLNKRTQEDTQEQAQDQPIEQRFDIENQLLSRVSLNRFRVSRLSTTK